MNWWQRIWRRDVLERDLDAELRFHVERQVAENIRQGMSEREARRQARLEFGGLDQIKEHCRDARGTRWLEDIGQDVRFASRLLWKDRWFTLVTVTTLALCIGGNVAVFAVVHSVLLKPLPVPEPERIVLMVDAYPNAFPGGGEGRVGTSPAHYFDRLTDVEVFEEQALAQPRNFAVGEQGRPEQQPGLAVTPSFFRLFRVSPVLGRSFREAEAELGQEQTVVLSHAVWRQRFDGDPDVIGRDLRIDGRPREIVGVMPADFDFVGGNDIRLWIPLALTDQEKAARHGGPASWMFGRLKAGATLEQARTQIEALNARNLERFPFFTDFVTDAGFHTIVVPLQDDMVRDVRDVLYLLWGGVAFVLLIGAVNVTNLTIFRSSVRMKEFGMRVALGAGRWRVARQVLTESLLLTLAGAAVGLLLGAWCLEFLGVFGVGQLPRGSEIGMDATVIWLTLGTALVLDGVLGLSPVASIPTSHLQTVLHRAGRSATMSRTTRLVQQGLVVMQTSVAFILLAGAVLLLVSFQRALGVDPGFASDHLLTANVTLPTSRYADANQRRAFADRAIERIRNLPGVTAAGLTDGLPFGTCCSTVVVSPEGYVSNSGEAGVAPNRVMVDVGYFRAMGIPLLEGRFFDERDTADSMRAVIVDPVLAHRFWPDESPLGKRMYYGVDVTPTTRFITVVGVVGQHAMRGVEDLLSTVGAYFVPHAQSELPVTRMTFAFRMMGDPQSVVNAVRAEIAAIDADLPVFDVQTMEERISNQLTPRRTPMLLSVVFALVALFLSALGAHAAFAYRLAQRSREFAVRLALGSSPGKVFTLVVSEGVRVLAVGLAVGMVGAVALSAVIASQLYETRPLDPVLLVATVAMLAVVALLASMVSAKRAAQVNPVSVLNDA